MFLPPAVDFVGLKVLLDAQFAQRTQACRHADIQTYRHTDIQTQTHNTNGASPTPAKAVQPQPLCPLTTTGRPSGATQSPGSQSRPKNTSSSKLMMTSPAFGTRWMFAWMASEENAGSVLRWSWKKSLCRTTRTRGWLKFSHRGGSSSSLCKMMTSPLYHGMCLSNDRSALQRQKTGGASQHTTQTGRSRGWTARHSQPQLPVVPVTGPR